VACDAGMPTLQAAMFLVAVQDAQHLFSQAC